MGGVGDEAQVGLVVFIQRRGDADDDGVHRRELGIVGGCGKAVGLGGLDLLRRNAVDVGAALGQGVDLARVDVEARHLEFLLAVEQSQREPNVSQPDDAHAGLALLNSSLELIERSICGRVRRS